MYATEAPQFNGAETDKEHWRWRKKNPTFMNSFNLIKSNCTCGRDMEFVTPPHTFHPSTAKKPGNTPVNASKMYMFFV